MERLQRRHEAGQEHGIDVVAGHRRPVPRADQMRRPLLSLERVGHLGRVVRGEPRQLLQQAVRLRPPRPSCAVGLSPLAPRLLASPLLAHPGSVKRAPVMTGTVVRNVRLMS